MDNLAKSVMDALTSAGIWTDDALVETLVVRKRWAVPGEIEGFRISLEPCSC